MSEFFGEKSAQREDCQPEPLVMGIVEQIEESGISTPEIAAFLRDSYDNDALTVDQCMTIAAHLGL